MAITRSRLQAEATTPGDADRPPEPGIARMARAAGALYLVIIVAGLGAELGVRAQLVDLADPDRTAAAILAAPGLFRLGLAADALMAVCDAGLAVLLYLILRASGPGVALSAMVFRLVQTAVIAANLLALQAVWLLVSDGAGLPAAQARSLALLFLDLHAHGYDLGLVFFGVSSLLTGLLVWRSHLFARVFGAGLAIAGLVYLVGSGLRFLAPGLWSAFTPAYGLTILAETAFCLRLLLWKTGP